MKKSNALWGALLIFIGLVWILNSTHLVNIDIWGSVMDLWPVFIIAAGITFFFKRESHIQRVVLWILVFALIGGYGIYLGYNDVSGTDLDKTFAMAPEIQSASLEVSLGSANFDIGSTDQKLADIRTNVKGIQYTYDEGSNPKIKYTQKGKFNVIKGRQNFNASLNNIVPWVIEFNAGVTNGTINLTDIVLERCTINTGSCDLDISVGNKQEDARIIINGGAVNLKLMLPKDVGLKISSSSVVTEVNGSVNMVKEGHILFSDNYASAPNKLDLEVSSGVTKVTVNH